MKVEENKEDMSGEKREKNIHAKTIQRIYVRGINIQR
jgi:hypothetical protein